MFFNVKELDEAYELAEIATEVPDPDTCSKALMDAKVSALTETWRRSRLYRKEGFREDVIHTIHNKRLKMIREAMTVADVKEIMSEPKPRYDGNAFSAGRFSIPEEEMIQWSLASLKAPIHGEAFERYMELFQSVFGVDPRDPELKGPIRLEVEDDVELSEQRSS